MCPHINICWCVDDDRIWFACMGRCPGLIGWGIMAKLTFRGFNIFCSASDSSEIFRSVIDARSPKTCCLRAFSCHQPDRISCIGQSSKCISSFITHRLDEGFTWILSLFYKSSNKCNAYGLVAMHQNISQCKMFHLLLIFTCELWMIHLVLEENRCQKWSEGVNRT